MAGFILILKFFGLMILFFAISWLISHVTGLDKYYDEFLRKRHK